MSSKNSSDGNSSTGNSLEEWKEIRSVVARLDENLHDLRKYGFVFLASLFAVDSIQVYFSFPEFVRCLLLIITIVFIVTIRLLDRNYQQLEKAVQFRARILEVNLNLELMDTIDLHYTGWYSSPEYVKFGDFIKKLYYGFMTVTLILGIAILFPTNAFANKSLLLSATPYYIGLAVAIAFGFYYLRNISNSLKISNELLGFDDVRDWTLDKVMCEKGESVKITVTNLGHKTCLFEKDKPAFLIKNDYGYLYEEKPKEDIFVSGDFGNHSWLWNTSDKNVEPNRIYQVIPIERAMRNLPENLEKTIILQPLRRTIAVCQKDK